MATTVYTNAGATVVTTAIQASTACFVGWGTGAGVSAKTDTDLFTPATESRVAAAESLPTFDKDQWIATITANGVKTITNAGLFDAAGAGNPPSGGNLIIHGDFTGIALGTGDSIQFTITLQQT